MVPQPPASAAAVAAADHHEDYESALAGRLDGEPYLEVVPLPRHTGLEPTARSPPARPPESPRKAARGAGPGKVDLRQAGL